LRGERKSDAAKKEVKRKKKNPLVKVCELMVGKKEVPRCHGPRRAVKKRKEGKKKSPSLVKKAISPENSEVRGKEKKKKPLNFREKREPVRNWEKKSLLLGRGFRGGRRGRHPPFRERGADRAGGERKKKGLRDPGQGERAASHGKEKSGFTIIPGSRVTC